MKRFGDYIRQLIPQDEEIIEMIQEAGENVRSVVPLLHRLRDAKNHHEIIGLRNEFKVKEHTGDDLTQRILERIHMSFATPLGREDLIRLTTSLDDVIDMIDSLVSKLAVYKIASLDPTMIRFIQVIISGVEEVTGLVTHIADRTRDHEAFNAKMEKIHQLENEGDTLLNAGVGELFETCTDAIKVLKIERIYSFLEQITDTIEDLSNVIELIYRQEL